MQTCRSQVIADYQQRLLRHCWQPLSSALWVCGRPTVGSLDGFGNVCRPVGSLDR